MKWLVSLFICFIAFLSADIHTLRLRDLGSTRYFTDDAQIKKIQRLSKMDELMYTCIYGYGEDGILISERLINAEGATIYQNNFDLIDEQLCINEPNTHLYTEYDSLGNLIKLEDKTFIYDKQNRLTKVITPTNIIEYSYDGSSGKRISRTLNGCTEFYIYHGINELARIDETGNVIELRVPGISPHKDILRPIAIETQNAIYVPVQNHQGTITALIDIATGEKIQLEVADAFGRGLDQHAPTAWIFSGKNYDKEAGLVYFGARYYSPDLGKWLTPDPMYQSDDPYLYCLGDPINFIDPDGKWGFAIPLVNIACGAGIAITSPIWGPCAVAVAAGATIGYWGYKGYKQYKETYGDASVVERSKKGGVDPSLPKNPKKDKNWDDVSHPEAKSNGRHKYRNKKTGEIIEFDEAKPGNPGHKAHDHYHRPNPNKTGKQNEYLDQYGNPVPNGSDASHLYPPEWVWWK